MRKAIIRILTLILAITSLFAVTLFAGCDCGGSSSDNFIPRPEQQVEKTLKLDASKLSMIVGDEKKLTASFQREEGKTLTFASSDTNVATIDQNGNVVAMRDGTAKITATYGDLTAECAVSVSFGNYLPELSFESGVLDVYNIGLDGIAYAFNPVIKFNNKIFTDVEAVFTPANESIVKFDGASATAVALGETTATITASWRGFTIDTVPGLQKVVNIKTHNVASFLINDRYFDVVELSSFDGVFEGVNYSNNTDFDVKVLYNGQVVNGNVKVDIEDTSTVVFQNDKLVAKEAGKTTITLSYKDELGDEYVSTVIASVVRPVADSGKKFFYFSAAHGYYKDVKNNYANKSIIKEIFGNESSKVVDATTEDGRTLRISGDKILNVPTKNDDTCVSTIIIGTSTYAYSCEIEAYGAIIANKEDLQVLNVNYTFDKAVFDAMPDTTLKQKAAKVAYLEACELDPYTHIDGYSILVNDIDATGVTLEHKALAAVPTKTIKYKDTTGKDQSYTFINGEVGFVADENANKLVALNKDAPIVYNGKAYNIPREGYPLVGAYLSVADNATSDNGKVYSMAYTGVSSSFFQKMGLLGTFDGQGHIISNFNSTETKIAFKKGTEDSNNIRNGAGLFGIVNAGAVVRNVAVHNFTGKGSVFAYLDQSPSAFGSSGHNYSNGDVWDGNNLYGTEPQSYVRTVFENIYVYTEEDTVYGLLYANTRGSRGAAFNNILVNLPKVKNGGLKGNNQWDKTITAFLGGSVNFSQSNYSLKPTASNVYVVLGGENGLSPILDEHGIVVAGTLNELYSKTETLNGKKQSAIAVAFNGNTLWGCVDVDANGDKNVGDAVYWNGLYEYSYYRLDKQSIELSKNVTSVKVGLYDLFGKPASASQFEVKFNNADALKYENGAIAVKNYVSGSFVATFLINGVKFEIPVNVELIEEQTAYLSQVDGEIVFPYLNAAQVATYANAEVTVDGRATTAKLENGKLYIDLASVGINKNEVLKESSFKYAVINNGTKNYYTLSYVTKAIDEGEDLAFFNVTYKFDQAYYNTLNDTQKAAYLKECQDDPFTHFDGYYVLVKDIDASGVELVHDALIDVAGNGNYSGFSTKTIKVDGTNYTVPNGLMGVLADEINNKYTVVNPMAQDFNGDGVVSGIETSYVFPRAGYPLVGRYSERIANESSPTSYIYTSSVIGYTTTNFDRIGLYGTFDGQGYVINKLNSAATTRKLMKGEDEVTCQVTGAGVFGMINNGSVVRNVAFNNFNGNGSAVALIAQVPRDDAAYGSGDVWANDNAYGFTQSNDRALMENIYVHNANTAAYGLLYRRNAGVGADMRNILINSPNLDAANANKGANQEAQGSLIGGSAWYNNGAGNSVSPKITNVYVFAKGLNTAKTEWSWPSMVWSSESLADLYAKDTTTPYKGADNGSKYKTIGEVFSGLSFWAISDTNGDGTKGAGDTVYWKRLGLPLEASVTGLVFTEDERTQEVALTLNGVAVTNASVTFSVDGIFTYANGVVTMTNHVAGYYEVTFSYAGSQVTLPINVYGELKTAYLSQVDGEMLEHGLSSTEVSALNGASVRINNKQTTASVVDGKVFIDLATAGVDLTEVLTADSKLTATIVTSAKSYDFTFKYVTKAIDEAEDLTYFNVGYTFDEAYYNTLGETEKAKYLAKAQASPFDYYEGYYVLLNDIDASNVVLNHEAVVAPIADGGITASNTAFTAVAGELNVPRAGYPVNNGFVSMADVKVGFRGTFEGNGHIIYNLNKTVRNDIKYVTTEGAEGTAYSMGAGLFGVLGVTAKVQNVAFYNMNVGNSSGLSMYIAGGSSSKNGRVQITNVFIKTADSVNNSGIISSQSGNAAGLRMTFVVIEATSHTAKAPSGSGLTGGIQGGEYSWPNNMSNCSVARLVYIAASYKAIELIHPSLEDSSTYTAWNGHIFNAVHQGAYAKITNLPTNYKDLCASADWNGTPTDTSDDITMVDAFSKEISVHTSSVGDIKGDYSAYWTKVGNGIYWNGLEDYYIGFESNEVELTLDENSKEVSLVEAAGGNVEAVVTVSDANVLEYVDGVISYKTYKPGAYEVTFTYNGKDYVLVVNIAYVKMTGYLSQADGEVLKHGLSSAELSALDGATVTISGKQSTASVVDGKLYIDLASAGVDLTEVLNADSKLIATIENDVTGYSFDFNYVSKVIDDASDLEYFNVTYKFNQEEYNKLVAAGDEDAVKAYLEECAADPFTHFDGYYVMFNDIDASSVSMKHDAYVGDANLVTNKIGFIANETTDKIEALDENAAIEFGGVKYNIPRAGYPLVGSYTAYNEETSTYTGLKTVTSTDFAKIGFYGTFDGQGYVIKNLTSSYSAVTYNTATGTAETNRYGGGIFGVMHSNAVVKNLALTGFKGTGSAFATYINDVVSYTKTDGDYWTTTRGRALFENIYIELVAEKAYGLFYRTHNARNANYKNIFVKAENLVTNFKQGAIANSENALLGGSQYHNVTTANQGYAMAATNVFIYTNVGKHDFNVFRTLVWATKSYSENIYTKATAANGADHATMGEAFSELPFWTVVDVNGDGEAQGDLVYWSRLKSTLQYAVNEIELSAETTEADLELTINGIAAVPEQVVFENADIFSYANGKITLNKYVPGTFNATVIIDGNDLPLVISVAYQQMTGYLSQVDGEVLEHKLLGAEVSALDGATVTISGKQSTASVENGKLYIDLATAGVDLTEVLTADSKLTATVVTDTVGYSFDFKYVTKAIDEASDLTYFNVGYTFDEAYYNTLGETEKAAYLAEKQASPFDYYEGYYVLLNDIDASGVVFNHEAVVAPIADGGITGSATEFTAVAGELNVPRAGYPINNGFVSVVGVKVGFRGTFEGNGHIIYNLNKTARSDIKYVTTEGAEGTAYSMGAGLFGVLGVTAKVQNVAFYDMNVGNSSGLSMYIACNSRSTAGRALIQNVFIKTAESTNNCGIISSSSGNAAGLNMRWVVIDAMSHTAKAPTASGLTGGIQGGENTWPNNGSNCSFARLVYISARYSAVELIHPTLERGGSNTAYGSHIFNAVHQGQYVKITNFPANYKDLCASVDYNGTIATNVAEGVDHTADDISMVQAFSGNVTVQSPFGNYSGDYSAYWTKVGNGIYWNGLEGYYVGLASEEVELTVDENSVSAGLVDATGGYVEAEVEFNTDVLEYVDGKIAYKTYKPGTYEATFTYNGKEYTVIVTIANIKKNAYLSQVDGEIVNPGLEGEALEALDGATVTIGEKQTTASIVDGKAYIDLAGASIDQTAVLKDGSTLNATIVAADTAYDYTFVYATKVIDEASELAMFNTTYKFTQAKYEELLAAGDETAVKAYLEECAADPFTHFDGYYVLANDIDATGIVLKHEAFMNRLPTKTVSYTLSGASKTFTWIDGEIGFIANDADNKYEALNPNAPINYGGVTYNIPRDGYPLVGNYTAVTDNETSALNGKVYTMANIGVAYCYFDRIGFYGTFDGQGYVISNFTSAYAGYAYKNGTTDATRSFYGPGLFGVTSAGSVVKNVAFNNFGGSGSAIAGYSSSSTSTADGDVWAENKQGTARALYENMYINFKDTKAYGLLYRTNIGAGTEFKNVFIYAPNCTSIDANTGYKENGLLGTSTWLNNGPGNSASPKITNAYVLAGTAQTGTSAWGWNQIIWATGSLDNLYAQATGTNGGAHATIGEAFSTLPYWTVVDTNEDGIKGAGDAVYWARLAPQA